MKKDFLEIGQIVGTHGIKGEVRLNPWCDGPEFVRQHKTLYFDAAGEYPVQVEACRSHGNIAILKLAGIHTVEDAAALRNKMLYMKRDDANLPAGKWFVAELIGCRVVDEADESVCYGEITDVATTGANDVWFVRTPAGKEVLIPAIPEVLISCEVEHNIVRIHALRGLFDAD